MISETTSHTSPDVPADLPGPLAFPCELLETERTALGDQGLVPGVRPLTTRESIFSLSWMRPCARKGRRSPARSGSSTRMHATSSTCSTSCALRPKAAPGSSCPCPALSPRRRPGPRSALPAQLPYPCVLRDAR